MLPNETHESFKFRYFHQVEEIAIRFDFLPIASIVSGRCSQALIIENDFNTFIARRDWFDDFNVPKENSLSVNSTHVHLYSAESLGDLSNH